jgi:hypothetical protein
MKKSSAPLTLIEARREFAALAKAFDDYVAKTKHLKTGFCLTSSIGGELLVKTDDPDLPWLPLLYAAANVMDREGDSPAEIRENFEHFLKDIVAKQGNGNAAAPRVKHPFESMRAVMVTTVNELMPVLHLMHEFDAIVARVGGEDALKMALVKAFHGALLGVLERSAVHVDRG